MFCSPLGYHYRPGQIEAHGDEGDDSEPDVKRGEEVDDSDDDVDDRGSNVEDEVWQQGVDAVGTWKCQRGFSKLGPTQS